MIYAWIAVTVVVLLLAWGLAEKTGIGERWKERARQWRINRALQKKVQDHLARPSAGWSDRAKRLMRDRNEMRNPGDPDTPIGGTDGGSED